MCWFLNIEQRQRKVSSVGRGGGGASLSVLVWAQNPWNKENVPNKKNVLGHSHDKILSRGNMPPPPPPQTLDGTHSHDYILSHGNMFPLRDLMGNGGGGTTHSHDKILSRGNMSPPSETWLETGRGGGTHL